MISKSCVKITITKQEAEKLEIGFENFENECPKVKTFLTYIIAIMSDMGIFNSPDDHISIEVFEQENQDIIVYISAYPTEKTASNKYANFILSTKNPDDLFAITTNSPDLWGKILDPELYFYSGLYHLIFKSNLSERKIRSIFRTEKISQCNNINIAKIKEYGTFLCDTPFEKLI